MKIYVLKENYPYEEGYLIKGVFSNKELAESIQKRLKEEQKQAGYHHSSFIEEYESYSIEEYDLDQEVD